MFETTSPFVSVKSYSKVLFKDSSDHSGIFQNRNLVRRLSPDFYLRQFGEVIGWVSSGCRNKEVGEPILPYEEKITFSPMKSILWVL
jgi:hypothetical protein